MLRYLRYLRYLFLVLLGLCLVTVALANRDVVLLRLLPEELAHFAGITWEIRLPLFLVVFGGIVAGLLIGFVWEWMREARHRAEATRAKRDAKHLEREVKRLKRKAAPEHQDDVLALLEDGGKAG
ncbi:lipopolysaccharide assembly protein LapA domain-containing protein [Actibacterium sp. D379-3]